MRHERDSWALAAAVALFYLCFHSYFYNFDGVACAVAVELGSFKQLVHGNHLAYGVAGWAFFQLWRLLGYRGPALLALQALDSLLGAATAGVFHSTLRGLGLRRSLAAACAVGLSLSYAFWFWSLDAQVYPLGNFFIALALREALRRGPRPARLGLLQGLAALGHVAHVMFAPAAVYALWGARGGRARRLAVWAGSAAAVVAAAYVWAGVCCVRPRSLDELRVWLLGSAALTSNKSFAWHGGYTAGQVREWLLMCARVISDFTGLEGAARAASLTLAAAALALAVRGAARGRLSARRPAVTIAALWLPAYAALFLSWEAFTVVYRISDLLPLWLLISLGLEGAGGALAAGTLAAGLAAVNGVFLIAPVTSPPSNPSYEEAVWAGKRAPAGAWIVATSVGQVYYPYFAHLKPLNMRYWDGRLDTLARRLDELSASGERVFATRRTLEAGGWLRWFEGYGLETAAEGREGTLYEVRRAGSRSAARRRD